jgi:hypothetical protein
MHVRETQVRELDVIAVFIYRVQQDALNIHGGMEADLHRSSPAH